VNDGAPPERPPPLWRRIAARVALVGGLALVLTWAAPRVPHDQVLVFRLPDAASVRRLEFVCTREGQREPLRGATLRYDSAAPSSVRHRLSLPNGRYVLSISVERQLPDGLTETSFLRRVSLDGGETVVALERAP